MLAYNDHDRPFHGMAKGRGSISGKRRDTLMIAVSKDGGESWQNVARLDPPMSVTSHGEDNPAVNMMFHYPTMLQRNQTAMAGRGRPLQRRARRCWWPTPGRTTRTARQRTHPTWMESGWRSWTWRLWELGAVTSGRRRPQRSASGPTEELGSEAEPPAPPPPPPRQPSTPLLFPLTLLPFSFVHLER